MNFYNCIFRLNSRIKRIFDVSHRAYQDQGSMERNQNARPHFNQKATSILFNYLGKPVLRNIQGSHVLSHESLVKASIFIFTKRSIEVIGTIAKSSTVSTVAIIEAP